MVFHSLTEEEDEVNTPTYLNSLFDIIFDVLDFLLLLSERQWNTF